MATSPTGFDQWIGFILVDEGPELNQNAQEPGGASRFGVSVDALTDYHHSVGLPVATIADVVAITSDQAIAFYRWYLSSLMLDQLPAAIAYRLADIATNLGQVGGARALCLALGVWPLSDQVTPALCGAARQLDQTQLICALSGVWMGQKHGAGKGWEQDGHGWTARRSKAHARALSLITVALGANSVSSGRTL